MEIVSSVLEKCGYKTSYIVQPYGRHIRSYSDWGDADGVMTVPLEMDLDGHETSAYIWYQNGVIYDENRIGEINSSADLFGREVVTFAKGKKILNLEEEIGDASKVYEIANQDLHPKMLLYGRVEAVLAEFTAFEVVFNKLMKEDSVSRDLARYSSLRKKPIFEPSPYKMVFRNKAVAKKFDQCYNESMKQLESVIMSKSPP